VRLLRSAAHRRATLVVTNDAVFAGAVADRVIEHGQKREREAILVA
jgi:ABC-type polar amino acid transport system ATPase subunit